MSDSADQKIEINEVVMRDGLQMESRFIATNDKIDLANTLGQLGYARIEVTSLTSPKAIPMLADAEQLMQNIKRVAGVRYTALVPNLRGAERAIDCGVDEFNLVMSASETHNLCNLRMTREQSFAGLVAVTEMAADHHLPVNISLSCSFGCPMEGDVASSEILHWVERIAALGVDGISLCDTTGMAFPSQARALCAEVVENYPGTAITGHFHNTRGMGLANVVAALQAGVTRFDTSLGGLGGCPYAPGATGNVATDEVVHMLHCMGYDTGIELAPLRAAAAELEALVGHSLSSQVYHSGDRLTAHAPPAGFDEIRHRALSRR